MMPKSQSAGDKPVMMFRGKKAWAAWLDKNHGTSSGVWLRLAKKDSGLKTVNYAEALVVALCYGWIDGQKRATTRNTGCKHSRRAGSVASGRSAIERRCLR